MGLFWVGRKNDAGLVVERQLQLCCSRRLSSFSLHVCTVFVFHANGFLCKYCSHAAHLSKNMLDRVAKSLGTHSGRLAGRPGSGAATVSAV